MQFESIQFLDWPTEKSLSSQDSICFRQAEKVLTVSDFEGIEAAKLISALVASLFVFEPAKSSLKTSPLDVADLPIFLPGVVSS